MRCAVCDRLSTWDAIHSYFAPDKYEVAAELKKTHRVWRRCFNCGHYQQWRNYDIRKLESVYTEHYRSESFREKSIEDSFNDLWSLPATKREAYARIVQFCMWVGNEDATILDYGSGIGIWPYELRNNGFKSITCTELNRDSIDFIRNRLDFECYKDYTGPKVDIVSIVHVLEHFEHPVKFLKSLQKHLKPAGKLFIEVPDSIEFTYLPKDHDEFNSCHCHFYDIGNLAKILEKAGYLLCEFHSALYNSRQLSRIQAMAVRHET